MTSIIIIGSGMGGLAAGIYGQMNGFETRIFEAHSMAVLGLVLLTNTLLIAGIYEWFQFPRRIEQLPWLFTTSGVFLARAAQCQPCHCCCYGNQTE